LTPILTDKIYEQTTTNDILPFEQKELRKKDRCCKDHLMLEKIFSEDAKRKKRSISMIRIYYKKAYYSVPHSWLIEAMKIYNIDETIFNFIRVLMPT